MCLRDNNLALYFLHSYTYDSLNRCWRHVIALPRESRTCVQRMFGNCCIRYWRPKSRLSFGHTSYCKWNRDSTAHTDDWTLRMHVNFFAPIVTERLRCDMVAYSRSTQPSLGTLSTTSREADTGERSSDSNWITAWETARGLWTESGVTTVEWAESTYFVPLFCWMWLAWLGFFSL